MKKEIKNKILLSLALLISLAALESFLFWPKMIYVAFGVINILVIAAVWRLIKNNEIKSGWLKFIILPVIFISGAIAYASLIPEASFINKFFVQCLFGAILYFIAHYLRQLTLYLEQPAVPNNLIDFSSGASFLALFFAVAAIFGLQLLLDLSYGVLILFVMLIVALLTYQLLWLNNWRSKEIWLFVIISVFALTQIAWALYFLPFDYNILGLLSVLAYYLLINAIKLYAIGHLDRRNLKPLLIFLFIILALIFLTVKWR